MAANVALTFPLVPNVGGGYATAANVVSDGGGTIGTDMFLVYTSGADGSWLARARFMPVASAAATATTATVARLYISTQSSGATTNANTFHIGEIALPSITAGSASVANFSLELPFNYAIPTGRFLLLSNHAAPAANTRWLCMFPGSGNY